MRKWLSGLFLIGLYTTTLPAVPHEREFTLLDLNGGYRWDDLEWSSTFPLNPPRGCHQCKEPHAPHVVSKLKWSDLTMYHVLASARYVTCDNYYFRGVADYGRIWHGHHKDRDYLSSDCNKNEFLGARADSNEGETFDLSAGMGYFFRFLANRAAIAPIAGYSHHEQHLRMSHLNIVVNEIDGFIGPVPGLHSNYRAQWYGPWAGLDLNLKMTCNLEIYGRGEFHWATFRGKGHWNLRNDFSEDFKQRSSGNGQLYYVGINYDLTSRWKLGIVYSFQKWHTKDGKLHQFFNNESVYIHLRPVHWVSQTAALNLEFRY